MADEAASLNKLRQLKTTEKIAIWERWVVSTIVLPKSALRKRWRCYWETRRQRATCADSNRQSKKNIWKKNHLLLRILAVIGRYGPHLMIVMIFVTQNNLKRSRNQFPTVSLDFTQAAISAFSPVGCEPNRTGHCHADCMSLVSFTMQQTLTACCEVIAILSNGSAAFSLAVCECMCVVWILAVIGRYGPHLMIVMIFVTQNNF